jgi:hypothetical protein
MAKQEFDNNNRGALWVNDDQREGKQDPDFRGNILIKVPHEEILDNGDGTATIHRFIAGWQANSSKVGDYISVSVGQKCNKTHGE